MLVLSMKVGEALTIGEECYIRFDEKSGRNIRVAIATVHAVNRVPTGVIPTRYITGILQKPEQLRYAS